ncbi:MAG TPA: hypothetical protein VG733_12860 [Chthoniobacteraceae bacterium]|nr:hypothetical protein [Chthoniobacteraceae bacterium]
MDTALPGIAPHAPTNTRSSSPARWIVTATLVCWIIFPIVMGHLFATNLYGDGDNPPAIFTTLLFLAGLPGMAAAFLTHLPPAWLFYCPCALLAVFAWLETLAWKRRITWLAVALLAWLLWNMAFIVSAYRME